MRSAQWREGYMAYDEGHKRYDNPYHPCTNAADEWIEGWLAAQKFDME